MAWQEDEADIRDHMIDKLDYSLVPEEAWLLLLDRFGLAAGQQPVRRKVFEYGMFVKQGVVQHLDIKKNRFCENGLVGLCFEPIVGH